MVKKVVSIVKKAIRGHVGMVKSGITGHAGMVKKAIIGHVGRVKKAIIGHVGMVKKAIIGHVGRVKMAIKGHVGMVKKAMLKQDMAISFVNHQGGHNTGRVGIVKYTMLNGQELQVMLVRYMGFLHGQDQGHSVRTRWHAQELKTKDLHI